MVRSNTLGLSIIFTDLLECGNKIALDREFGKLDNFTVSAGKQ